MQRQIDILTTQIASWDSIGGLNMHMMQSPGNRKAVDTNDINSALSSSRPYSATGSEDGRSVGGSVNTDRGHRLPSGSGYRAVDKARGGGGHGSNNGSRRASDAEKSSKNHHDRQYPNTSSTGRNNNDHHHDNKHSKATTDSVPSHSKDSVPQQSESIKSLYEEETATVVSQPPLIPSSEENNDLKSVTDIPVKSSVPKSITYAEPMVKAADYYELKRSSEKLHADLKDYKNKIKVELLQVLDIINVDFLSKIVNGIENLMLQAYKSGTYVFASGAELQPTQNGTATSKPIGTRKASSLGNANTSTCSNSSVESASVFDVTKPLPVSNRNVAISDSLASPMTAMTDSFSVEEEIVNDEITVSVLEDDNKSLVSGNNFGAAKSTVPAFSSSFPLVISQPSKLLNIQFHFEDF